MGKRIKKMISLDEKSLKISSKMKNFSKFIRDVLKVHNEHLEEE